MKNTHEGYFQHDDTTEKTAIDTDMFSLNEFTMGYLYRRRLKYYVSVQEVEVVTTNVIDSANRNPS